jgi:hypothetical protein
MSWNRRQFLRTTTAGGLTLGLGDLAFLGRLPAVAAADTELPRVVQLQSGIEPLVRLLEETPRPRLLEEVAARIRKGLSYRDVLAALLLAGVRNVEPRPHVGFKFHAVLVVNSAHLASLASPDSERWLPLFWALDYFKTAQAKNLEESKGWRMAPVNESAVPPARKARQALAQALENFDAEAADPAIAALVRSAGADEVFEVMWRYAPRDFRDIGHKIIFASNSRRTLDCIGWEHAEPVLRSLAYALVYHGKDQPTKRDEPADRAGKRNRELVKQIRPEWLEGKAHAGAVTDLLSTLRQAPEEGACADVVELLNKGVAPQSVWDAVLASAVEMLMRRPGIVALHAVTSANALRFAYQSSGSDETRRWLLLQAAAFMALFRTELEKAGKLPDLALDRLEPLTPGSEKTADPILDIFGTLGKDRLAAARKVLGFLKDNPHPEKVMDAGRLLIFLKGNEAHDYKFSSAVLEDYYHVSPAWRDRYLAASMFHMRPSTQPDNNLVQRTRAALKG